MVNRTFFGPSLLTAPLRPLAPPLSLSPLWRAHNLQNLNAPDEGPHRPQNCKLAIKRGEGGERPAHCPRNQLRLMFSDTCGLKGYFLIMSDRVYLADGRILRKWTPTKTFENKLYIWNRTGRLKTYWVYIKEKTYGISNPLGHEKGYICCCSPETQAEIEQGQFQVVFSMQPDEELAILAGAGMVIYKPTPSQLADPMWINLTFRSLAEHTKQYFPKMQWTFSFGFTFRGDPYFCCSELTPNPLNLMPDRFE